jgi:hypothetical protein
VLSVRQELHFKYFRRSAFFKLLSRLKKESEGRQVPYIPTNIPLCLHVRWRCALSKLSLFVESVVQGNYVGRKPHGDCRGLLQ